MHVKLAIHDPDRDRPGRQRNRIAQRDQRDVAFQPRFKPDDFRVDYILHAGMKCVISYNDISHYDLINAIALAASYFNVNKTIRRKYPLGGYT